MVKRRSLLFGSLFPCAPAINARTDPSIELSIQFLPTGQYWQGIWRGSDNGNSAAQTLSRICHDPRTGEIHPLDPGLWDILSMVSMQMGCREWDIISGYRSPSTNVSLGGARRSFHALGRAIDVRMHRGALDRFASAARRAGAGGIGIYRERSFVHIDTRAHPYVWG
jgi:uncharacterized protein YcbK (DUF882 family)